HARPFIETAVQLGGVIQATDSDAVAARDREVTAAIREFRTPQPRLGPGWHAGAAGGDNGPQPVFEDGSRLDDAVGYRFALIVDEALVQHAQTALTNAAQRERVAIVPAKREPLRAGLADAGARAVLLRPDRYVCGVAHDASDVEALLARAGVACALQRREAA
ncbi:3-(3-hydroxyphenyl)propionate hydroxylase, partial [Paraburkholderia sp. BR14261]